MNINNEVLFSSDDDEIDSPNLPMLKFISSKSLEHRKFTQKHSNVIQKLRCGIRQHLYFIMRLIVTVLRRMKQILILIYLTFIFTVILPFIITKNILIYIKSRTILVSSIYFPFKNIIAILNQIRTLFLTIFLKRSGMHDLMQECNFRGINTNNNRNCRMRDCNNEVSIQQYVKSDKVNVRNILLLSLGCLLITFTLFSNINDNSEVSKTSSSINIKSFVRKYFEKIFMFPGERCMKTGRYGKGFLERFFRWFACLLTMPLREILFLWPKSNIDELLQSKSLNEVQKYINKVKEDLKEFKEEDNNQYEFIMNFQNKFIDLNENIFNRANLINKLKPTILNSIKNIRKLKRDIDSSMISLKGMIFMRHDIDHLLESIKLDANDMFNSAGVKISHLKESLVVEHRRLNSQIENLEIHFQENNLKVSGKNQRLLKKISNEISEIKNSQLDFKKRILPLLKLPLTFKEISNNLQEDLQNKINEEKVHREQMNKITKNSCSDNVGILEKELTKVKLELSCFTDRAIKTEAQKVEKKLRKDVSSSLNERIFQMVKILTEEAIFKEESYIMKQKVKKCSLLDHVFNLNVENSQCLKMRKFKQINNAKEMNERTAIKDKVDELIADNLRKFSADDIGLADYASESAGGSVISDRSSHTYTGRAAFLSLFGLTFGKVVKSLRKIIQPGTLPGECWAFKYNSGRVVIRLAKPIIITAITIDHVSPHLTPDGKILSAPKHFVLYALSNYDDYSGSNLGEFDYSNNGDPIQTFKLIKSSSVTQYIQVNFLSNHGNEEYTCIYRVRIHGNYNGNV